MDSKVMLLMFVAIFFIGMASTIIYWFARYYFNTDQEKAEIKMQNLKDEANQDQSAKQESES